MNIEDRITYLHEKVKNKSNKIQIISIDGNIGSGKSTLIKNLKLYYKDTPTIFFLDEPVNIWQNIKDKNNIDIISNYYKDQKNMLFHFK